MKKKELQKILNKEKKSKNGINKNEGQISNESYK